MQKTEILKGVNSFSILYYFKDVFCLFVCLFYEKKNKKNRNNNDDDKTPIFSRIVINYKLFSWF